MQNIAGLIATLGVLIAMSGILPIMTMWPAIAQEVPQKAIAHLSQEPQRQVRPEMSDINALTLESDFTVFMKSDCPPDLRLKALRKLWTLMPPTPIEENALF
jgi:hypothetical protein